MKELITIKDIPKEFVCIISRCILYEPAFVNGNKKQHYEYKVINKLQLEGGNDPFVHKEIEVITRDNDHQKKLCAYLKKEGVKIHGSLKKYMEQQVKKFSKDIPIGKNQTLLDVRTPEGKHLIEYAAESHSIKWITSYLKIYKNNQHDKELFQEKLQYALYAAIMSVESEKESTELYEIVKLLTQEIDNKTQKNDNKTQEIDNKYEYFCLHCDTSDIILKLVFKILVITCLQNSDLLKNMENFLKAMRNITSIRLKELLQQQDVYSNNHYLKNSISYCISDMILSKLLISSKLKDDLATLFLILHDWNNYKEKLSNIEKHYRIYDDIIEFLNKIMTECNLDKTQHNTFTSLLVKVVEWVAMDVNCQAVKLAEAKKYQEAEKFTDNNIKFIKNFINKLSKKYKLTLDLKKIYQKLIAAVVNKANILISQAVKLNCQGALNKYDESIEITQDWINKLTKEMKEYKLTLDLKKIYQGLITAVENKAHILIYQGSQLLDNNNLQGSLNKCGESMKIIQDCINKLPEKYKLALDLKSIYRRLITAVINKAYILNRQAFKLFDNNNLQEPLNKCGESMEIIQDCINKLPEKYKLTLDLTKIYQKLIISVAYKAYILNRQAFKLFDNNNHQGPLNKCGESMEIIQGCINKLPEKYKLTLDLTKIYRELITTVANKADVMISQAVKLFKSDNVKGALAKYNESIKITQGCINKLPEKYKLTLDLKKIYRELITAVANKTDVLTSQAIKSYNNNNYQEALNKCDEIIIEITQGCINKLTKEMKEYKLTLGLTVIYQRLMIVVAGKTDILNHQVIELEKTNKPKEAENKITESIKFIERYVNVLKIKNTNFSHFKKIYQVLVEFKNIISNKKYSITNNIVEKLKQHKNTLQSYLNMYPKRVVSSLIEPRIIFTLDCVNNCIETLLLDISKLIKLHNNKLDVVKKNLLAIQNILPYVAKLKNINFVNKELTNRISQLRSYIVISQKLFNEIIKGNNTNMSDLKQKVGKFKKDNNETKNRLICAMEQVVFNLKPQDHSCIIKILLDILLNKEIYTYLTTTNQKIPFENTLQIRMLCQQILLRIDALKIDALSYKNLNIMLGLVSMVGSIQTLNGISEKMMVLDRKKPKSKLKLKPKNKKVERNFSNFFKKERGSNEEFKHKKKRKLNNITGSDNLPESQKKKRKLNK